MKVKEIMTAGVTTASEDDGVERIIELMRDRGIGSVPVVDGDGRILGIVTGSDLLPEKHRGPFKTTGWAYMLGFSTPSADVEEILAGVKQKTAREVMSAPVVTVSEDDEIEAAVGIMMGHGIDHVPVTRDGVPIGMVTRRDLMTVMV